VTKTRKIGLVGGIGGLLWMVVTIGLAILLGNSTIVSIFAVVGWFLVAGCIGVYGYRFIFVKDEDDPSRNRPF